MDSSRPCLLHHSTHHHHHHHHHPLFLCPLPLPHHHHHHHLHILPHCPLHSYLLQPNSHHNACPNSLPLTNRSNLQVTGCGETFPSNALMMQEEGYEEGVVEEDEDEEEPVFVLTDEWKEFFAKSEAKRRLAKKQARKKGKV